MIPIRSVRMPRTLEVKHNIFRVIIYEHERQS